VTLPSARGQARDSRPFAPLEGKPAASGTYQRTLRLTLVAVAALPLAVATVATFVMLRQARLDLEQVAAISLMVSLGILGAAVSLAFGAARALGGPIQDLCEGVSMIIGPNRAHRLALPEEADLADLARGVNELAERADTTAEDLERRLSSATHELVVQRQMLTSVLFALADGVVVCNRDLNLVLSNAAARRMLSLPSRPLRRGESIFSYLNPAMLRPLVESLGAATGGSQQGQRLERGTLALPGGATVQVNATLAVDDQGQAHYVFVLRDVTQQVSVDRSRGQFLDASVRRLRSQATSLLSAAEILRAYDDLAEPQRRSFLDVLQRDAERLADELDAIHAQAVGTLAPSRTGDDVRVSQLAEWAAAELGPALAARGQRISTGGEPLIVRGDRLALLQVTRRLLELAVARAPQRANLSLRWRRVSASLLELAIELPRLEVEQDGLAEEQLFDIPLEDGQPGRSVRDVVREHHGELWVRGGPKGCALVLSLPASQATTPPDPGRDGDAVGQQVLALLSRGGFYEPGPRAEDRSERLAALAAHPEARLADLSYVVFDLETTGLEPGCDEVVSIGAVRVRGGRVIPEDHLHSLVNPGRRIPRLSTKIHGITDELVAGQPALDDVLPRFIEFVGRSVLVAHLAAFDLAFLNSRLGTMGRPAIRQAAVLDTLLLSCSLFPSWGGYNVEEIAARFGLAVVDRHTALGDALTTAEILIRLLEVLQRRGIETLGPALELQSGDLIRKLVGAVRAELSW